MKNTIKAVNIPDIVQKAIHNIDEKLQLNINNKRQVSNEYWTKIKIAKSRFTIIRLWPCCQQLLETLAQDIISLPSHQIPILHSESHGQYENEQADKQQLLNNDNQYIKDETLAIKAIEYYIVYLLVQNNGENTEDNFAENSLTSDNPFIKLFSSSNKTSASPTILPLIKTITDIIVSHVTTPLALGFEDVVIVINLFYQLIRKKLKKLNYQKDSDSLVTEDCKLIRVLLAIPELVDLLARNILFNKIETANWMIDNLLAINHPMFTNGHSSLPNNLATHRLTLLRIMSLLTTQARKLGFHLSKMDSNYTTLSKESVYLDRQRLNHVPLYDELHDTHQALKALVIEIKAINVIPNGAIPSPKENSRNELVKKHIGDFKQQQELYDSCLFKNKVRKNQAKKLFNDLKNVTTNLKNGHCDANDYYQAILTCIIQTQAAILNSDQSTTWNQKGYSRLYNISSRMFAQIASDYLADSTIPHQHTIPHQQKSNFVSTLLAQHVDYNKNHFLKKIMTLENRPSNQPQPIESKKKQFEFKRLLKLALNLTSKDIKKVHYLRNNLFILMVHNKHTDESIISEKQIFWRGLVPMANAGQSHQSSKSI